MGGKVLVALNSAWNAANFRAGLLAALVRDGREVVVVAPADAHVPALTALGCRFVPLPIDSHGLNPARELRLLWRFYRLLRAERPAVYLRYTIKPNVYGSIAAHLAGVPVVNNIAGLGSPFLAGGPLRGAVRALYRVALSRSAKVFFQNDEDLRLFVRERLVPAARADRLPGSGVDLRRFALAPPRAPGASHAQRFLMIARLLRDKGVLEYVEAAARVRALHPQARFALVGPIDATSPSAIAPAELARWVAAGTIDYLGVAADVRPLIAAADCVVLPSYREGTPRTLLEAAAMGRPVIATNVPGCRAVVDDGITGLLCRPRDAADLAAAILRMRALPPSAREAMGRLGRAKVEAEFDERVVVRRYRAVIQALEGEAARPRVLGDAPG